MNFQKIERKYELKKWKTALNEHFVSQDSPFRKWQNVEILAICVDENINRIKKINEKLFLDQFEENLNRCNEV